MNLDELEKMMKCFNDLLEKQMKNGSLNWKEETNQALIKYGISSVLGDLSQYMKDKDDINFETLGYFLYGQLLKLKYKIKINPIEFR